MNGLKKGEYHFTGISIGDGDFNQMTLDIRLNVNEIKEYARIYQISFEKAFARVVSHEEIHRCIFLLSLNNGFSHAQYISSGFDNYCSKFKETAIKYMMW